MRIEQYFLMTDYSLWEVILNGDSPAPTRVVDGVLQLVAPTTAEHLLARKNELKARGTLLMALPDKHQLKFNTHKDAKNLMKAKEKRFGVSAAASVSAVSAKIPVSALPNMDSLSNVVIYSFFASQSNSLQLDNDDLKQIYADDLEEMDLKWQMAMKRHFARECRSPKDTRRNGTVEPQRRNVPVETSISDALVSQCDGVGSYDWSFQAKDEPSSYALMAFSSSSSSFDNEVVSYSKACTKAYATLQSHYDKLTEDYRKSQFDVISYKTGLEYVEARLLVYQQNESVFEEDIKLLKLEVQLRDNALVSLRQNLEKAEQERDDLKLKLEKFQTSSKNLTELLASQTNAKLEDESETKTPQNVPSFVQPTEQVKSPRPSVQHVETSISAVTPKPASPKPTSNGKHMNRKSFFVCKSLDHLIKDCDYHENKMAQPTARNHPPRGNHKQYDQMTLSNPQRHVVPATVLTQSKHVPITAVRPVTTVVLKIKGNPQHALMDKGVIDSRCSRHMTGNVSYLSDFEELNGGYVAFGGNPKGGKISRKGKIRTGKLDFDDVYFVKELKFNLFSVSQMCDKKNIVLFTDSECLVLSHEFKLPDESQVLLRVPRENNMYNVNLKNIVPSGDLTCLFAKATLDESNLWHRRLGHINFKTMNKLVKGPAILLAYNRGSLVLSYLGLIRGAALTPNQCGAISSPLLVARTTPLPLGYSNKTNRNKPATLAFTYSFQAEPDPSEFGS
uniref:Ribonuclease H-like domain-containing protein n=1 Tax=Tanacetum cinerariifolium TaxID=118510 RepID=A0A6L2P5P3_TANCI|nr:ribonuclease H-like domain-containing protein [Tanacetum cinerariifolium]